MLVTSGAGNLSDGGVYLSVPADAAPAVGARVDLTFCVPRPDEASAGRTGRLEVFAGSARVLRQDDTGDQAFRGVAMRFQRPMQLPPA